MLVASAMPVAAQQTKLLTAEKHNEYGLVYTLPVTALDVEVTAVKETRKAGPYYQYAKKYVGTDKVVKDDAEVWTISSVKVRPYGMPDPDAKYLMQLKPGATTYIGVDSDGMLLSINKAPVIPAAEIVPAARQMPTRSATMSIFNMSMRISSLRSLLQNRPRCLLRTLWR